MGASKGKKMLDSSTVASSVLHVEICTHSFIFKAPKRWLLRRSQPYDIRHPQEVGGALSAARSGHVPAMGSSVRTPPSVQTLPERLRAPPPHPRAPHLGGDGLLRGPTRGALRNRAVDPRTPSSPEQPGQPGLGVPLTSLVAASDRKGSSCPEDTETG